MYLIHQGKHTRQAHVGLPDGSYEEEHGRHGFFGSVSHLYHAHPPTGWTRFEGPLRPHAFDTGRMTPPDADRAEAGSAPLLFNDDVALHISRRRETMPFFFRNGDADEIHFVHKGSGVLETEYGVLPFETGDYLVMPRGVTYRIHTGDTNAPADNFFLLIEAFSEVTPPSPEMKGLLGRHALYDLSAVRTPEMRPPMGASLEEYEIRVKRGGEITSIFYPHHPFDLVGWKGDLYPWKLSIRDIRPVMSPRVHLPPPVHTTFLMQNAVVCTFLPRPLEEDADALRVPFYHRNTDYDEVLFYHAGNFFSRDNIHPGMVTLHPSGFPHGPHPKALANQAKLARTDEAAVMLDTVNALRISPEAEMVEWQEYWESWKAK